MLELIRMKLPQTVAKYFWGDDLTELDFKKHQDYIIETILEQGNESAISWLLKQIPSHQLAKKLNSLKLSQRSKQFWQLVLK